MAERFVVEFANYKIRKYTDLNRNFPEREAFHNEQITKIDRLVRARDNELITVDETMRKLAEL